MKIVTVTVTGADDSIKPGELRRISEEFPHVEFGILLSRKQQGGPRFPSKRWLNKLPDGLQLSGHLCGAWVREILQGHWPIEELTDLLGADFFSRFSRWQLNTHGEQHEYSPSFLQTLSRGPRGVIFQFDNVNRLPLEAAIRYGNANVAALFDLSHGAGVLPEKWPGLLNGVFCGYAGGLSPENVSGECGKIAEIVGDAATWIDAETHLRSQGGLMFDPGKVREFLKNSQPYTV